MKQGSIGPLIDTAILLGLLFVTAFDYFIHDNDERPYLRDVERARTIRQHSLLKMPAQQWLSEVDKLVDKEMEKRP